MVVKIMVFSWTVTYEKDAPVAKLYIEARWPNSQDKVRTIVIEEK